MTSVQLHLNRTFFLITKYLISSCDEFYQPRWFSCSGSIYLTDLNRITHSSLFHHSYPTNYPVREYQLQIVGEALFKNTLVSLPTGLGKTFIAAVVMYNFYRWFPGGKVIFLAPTRPLVTQQIGACHDIVGIPHVCID